MRDKIKAMKHLFRRVDEVKFDFGEADRCFDVIRAVNFVARYQRRLQEEQASCSGPTSAPTTRSAPSMTLADFAWAHAEQTRIFRRFQELYRDYDLVLAPTTPASRRSRGRSSISRRWTARSCATTTTGWRPPTSITLATNPAISLPCGVDHKEMPFGLQVIGRFRGDGEVLGAAHAMEQAFKAIPGLGRPLPDICRKLESPRRR